MGQSSGSIRLVETAADVDGLLVRDPEKLSYVTQTTLSVDDAESVVSSLRNRFPEIQGPKVDDICYATQNRQDAVKALSARCRLVIVVGSPNSSNSNRLREVAELSGAVAYLVDSSVEIKREWFEPGLSVGITAGASAPEKLVRDVVQAVERLTGVRATDNAGVEEGISFPLPRELQ